MIRFWQGETMDHLYPTCPALVANSKAMGIDPPKEGAGSVGDPYDYTVCGWCQRVYRARHIDGRES